MRIATTHEWFGIGLSKGVSLLALRLDIGQACHIMLNVFTKPVCPNRNVSCSQVGGRTGQYL
eukprot:4933906-Amphidinium_carterae.2